MRSKRRPTSKQARGLETRTIVYGNRRYSYARHQQLTVDVRRGEVIDDDYAAAMVAARTGLAMGDVVVIKVTD